MERQEKLGYWVKVYEEAVRLLKQGIPAELAHARAKREVGLPQINLNLEAGK